jgi:hypothetical protein
MMGLMGWEEGQEQEQAGVCVWGVGLGG